MKSPLDASPIDIAIMRSVMPKRHQDALMEIARLYRGDTNDTINGLMDMTVRAAILGGVSAENFAAGIKAHWDAYANAINRAEN